MVENKVFLSNLILKPFTVLAFIDQEKIENTRCQREKYCGCLNFTCKTKRRMNFKLNTLELK